MGSLSQSRWHRGAGAGVVRSRGGNGGNAGGAGPGGGAGGIVVLIYQTGTMPTLDVGGGAGGIGVNGGGNGVDGDDGRTYVFQLS